MSVPAAPELRRNLVSLCERFRAESARASYGESAIRHGLTRAKDAVEQEPLLPDSLRWLRRIDAALERARNNSHDIDDEDGWGIGAVQSVRNEVQKLLEEFDNRERRVAAQRTLAAVVTQLREAFPDRHDALLDVAEPWFQDGEPACSVCCRFLPFYYACGSKRRPRSFYRAEVRGVRADYFVCALCAQQEGHLPPEQALGEILRALNGADEELLAGEVERFFGGRAFRSTGPSQCDLCGESRMCAIGRTTLCHACLRNAEEGLFVGELYAIPDWQMFINECLNGHQELRILESAYRELRVDLGVRPADAIDAFALRLGSELTRAADAAAIPTRRFHCIDLPPHFLIAVNVLFAGGRPSQNALMTFRRSVHDVLDRVPSGKRVYFSDDKSQADVTTRIELLLEA